MKKTTFLLIALFLCQMLISQPNNGFFNTEADLLNWQLSHEGSIRKVVEPSSPLFGDKVVFEQEGRRMKANVKELNYWGCAFNGQVYRFYKGKLYHVLSWGKVTLYGRNLLVQRGFDQRVASFEYTMGNNVIAIEQEEGNFVAASMHNIKSKIESSPEAVSLLPDSGLINEDYHNKLLYAINYYNRSEQ